MPRLYRESPLNAIWEGSGNVIALDVLRAAGRSPDSLQMFIAELETGSGFDARVDRAIAAATDAIATATDLEFEARRIVESMATAWAATLLARHGGEATFQAFTASRLAETHGGLYGTLPHGTPISDLLERAVPT